MRSARSIAPVLPRNLAAPDARSNAATPAGPDFALAFPRAPALRAGPFRARADCMSLPPWSNAALSAVADPILTRGPHGRRGHRVVGVTRRFLPTRTGSGDDGVGTTDDSSRGCTSSATSYGMACSCTPPTAVMVTNPEA